MRRRGGPQKGPPITMSTTKSTRRRQEGADAEQQAEAVVDRLAGLLPEDALQDAVKGLEPDEITGPGGLLSELAGRVIETALGAELTDHLGHPPGGVPSSGKVRNGSTSKTVATDLGPVKVNTPRDRDGSFEPQLVAKRQTRLAGLDDKILGLYAGGMTVRDISAHLAELYGVQIGRDTISRVTDAVLADVEAWRTRPLEAVYPIVYFDAMRVRVREDRSVRTWPATWRSGSPATARRGPGDLVARDRGRQVLAGGPQRSAPPRRRRRFDRLRRRADGLPRSDRGDLPACRPQTSRRQDPPRSPQSPQAPPRPPRLPAPATASQRRPRAPADHLTRRHDHRLRHPQQHFNLT
jgi:hypothetical protein